MRAIIQKGIRQLDVEMIETPIALPGTVIIKIGAAGICGTDLNGYRKDTTNYLLPHGHEYAGIIVKVGQGVSPSLIGLHVTADSFLNAMCGACEFCKRGQPFHCTNKILPFQTGGFAEYVRVKESAIFSLPDSVDDALGALVEPLAVAVHAVRKIGITSGMTGIVIGAGTIGLCALAAALDAGATRVFVVAKYAFQGELAKLIGADKILPARHDEALCWIMQNSPFGVDFAIEAVGGVQPTLDQACQFVRPMGAVGVVGAFDPGVKGIEFLPAHMKELTLHFSNCYGWLDGKHDFSVAIDLLTRKGEVLRKLITHEFSMANASRAFSVVDDKASKSIKVLIRP